MTLSPKQIRNKIITIKKKYKLLSDKEKEIQNNCPHINLTYENKGNSGGWDREEYYWRNWDCRDCGKRWQTDQTYDDLQLYPHAKQVKNGY